MLPRHRPGTTTWPRADVIVGSSRSVAGTNVEATKQPGEPDHAGNVGGSSIWYEWSAPRDTVVGLSRTLHFQPGYFYGALGGLVLAGALSEKTQARVTAANWVWALLLSVGAWLARVPVSEAAGRPDADLWWTGLEACLGLIFLWGVEGLSRDCSRCGSWTAARCSTGAAPSGRC